MSKKEEQDYEVERIVSHRYHKNKLQYKIHWAGYDSDEDTWENEDCLDGCQEVIKQYKEEIRENKLGNSLKENSGKNITKSNPPVFIINFVMFGGKKHVRVQLKDKTYATFTEEFIKSHYRNIPALKQKSV